MPQVCNIRVRREHHFSIGKTQAMKEAVTLSMDARMHAIKQNDLDRNHSKMVEKLIEKQAKFSKNKLSKAINQEETKLKTLKVYRELLNDEFSHDRFISTQYDFIKAQRKFDLSKDLQARVNLESRLIELGFSNRVLRHEINKKLNQQERSVKKAEALEQRLAQSRIKSDRVFDRKQTNSAMIRDMQKWFGKPPLKPKTYFSTRQRKMSVVGQIHLPPISPTKSHKRVPLITISENEAEDDPSKTSKTSIIYQDEEELNKVPKVENHGEDSTRCTSLPMNERLLNSPFIPKQYSLSEEEFKRLLSFVNKEYDYDPYELKVEKSLTQFTELSDIFSTAEPTFVKDECPKESLENGEKNDVVDSEKIYEKEQDSNDNLEDISADTKMVDEQKGH